MHETSGKDLKRMAKDTISVYIYPFETGSRSPEEKGIGEDVGLSSPKFQGFGGSPFRVYLRIESATAP